MSRGFLRLGYMMGWQKRPCKNTLCSATTSNTSRYCDKCSDRTRHTVVRDTRLTAHQRGYDAHWRKARAEHLSCHPLCVMCTSRQIVTAATVVDHITPHRGDYILFWDRANLQSLCKRCHDSDKQREERNG